MIHGGPSGPTITPCGAEPLPSGVSLDFAGLRVQPARALPVPCAVYQTPPSRAGATSCGWVPLRTGYSRTRSWCSAEVAPLAVAAATSATRNDEDAWTSSGLAPDVRPVRSDPEPAWRRTWRRRSRPRSRRGSSPHPTRRPARTSVRRYINVVHGASKRPRRGHSQLSNASSTRDPNSHIARIAKRGPRATKSRTKQHIRRLPPSSGTMASQGMPADQTSSVATVSASSPFRSPSADSRSLTRPPGGTLPHESPRPARTVVVRGRFHR